MCIVCMLMHVVNVCVCVYSRITVSCTQLAHFVPGFYVPVKLSLQFTGKMLLLLKVTIKTAENELLNI